MLKSRGSLPWTVRRYPEAKIRQIVFQKMQVIVQKMQVKPSFSFVTSQARDQWATGCIQTQGKQPRKYALYAVESWD
jgi:hypothetical protein